MTAVVFALLALAVARAETVPIHEDVVERYEQILERSPVEGPSFDKLLQIYQASEGLEKLDERWAPWSTQPGAKGATYSLLRGLLADRMGKTDAARKFLLTATQDAPDDFHVWLALGDFEVRQGKWTDAIAALQKGLATNVAGDDRLSFYRKLGQAQQRNLDVTAALATWQKMIEEFPKDHYALEEAGGAELDAEQFDAARATFQKLVDLTEPNSMSRVQTLMHLAEVDDRQGKTEAAVHDYEAILPLTAESSWLNRELRAQIEQVYRREDDLAGLVSYYQKWTQDNPKDVEALLLLAGTLNELGKKTEALEVLRKVTTLAPDRHEVRQSFAEALVEAKQYDEAITVLTALTVDDPTEPRYWETMGVALWLKTQPPTADSKKAVLDAWGHMAPPDAKDVAAIVQVADLCRDHGLNDEALAGYQRALVLSPDASDIREKAVKLLVDMKRPDDAWKLLDQMTEGPLATPTNYLKLATLDQQLDRKDAAAEAIQKGLALEPGNFDLLSMEWTRLAEAQKWSDCVALFDKLMAAAPNPYFAEQLEARQLQALTSAGMLADEEKKLHAKLGADPGLNEGELRLLLRMMIQQSDPDVAKALDEAHRRFPQSISLIRIEIDYDRHVGNDDAAVIALQKLIETVPQQKSEWLGEIVRIRRDQGNLDEALKGAQQIIDGSPASADGYLLYADIALVAEKPDDAVEKLQAAIKLSDKPNEIRQRLARYYLESGQAAKARTIYDEAFAAADTPQDKLAIARAMTAAYFQDGQIEQLINRFKKEQGSEEGGWRYGLYLSAIDEQMEDFGAARRELAKSLAVRPKDTALLHSLIGLADKDGDRGELLRYREMLAEADPTTTNEIALANEYAIQNKSEDAWRIVQKNMGELTKDPLAWKDVLNQITDPAYVTKVKGVLEEAIRAKSDSFEGKFALAQFQMQQGDIEGAKVTLWDILAEPLPPTTAPQVAASTPTPMGMATIFNIYQSPLMRRVQQSYLALNEAQQLLSASQQRNPLQQQIRMARMYSRMGVSATLDPAAIKDHALIYLSYIAVQQKQADTYLKELESKIDAWHWSVSEKLIAYTIIQAHDPLLPVIEEQAQTGKPDDQLDQFCYLSCEQFTGTNGDDEIRKRALAAQDVFANRLSQDPQFKSFHVVMEVDRLSSDSTPAGQAKRNAALAEYMKTVDRKDPGQLIQAIGLCAQVGNWDEIKKAVDDLATIDPSKWNLTATQQLAMLPEGLVDQATTTKTVLPKEVIPVVAELMKLGYPLTPPRASLPTGQSVGPGGMVVSGLVGTAFYSLNVFPPANRYFPIDRVGVLEPMYQQMKARDMMPAMYAALDQQEKELTDWRKIYPELLRIYFQWWDNKQDDAIASVRKLLEQDPSDDWKILLAKMLELQQKYAEAIPVLESVSARYGPDYIRAQKQLLHVARLAKDNDAGQKAGTRLLALHLPAQEQLQLLDDLRNVGLKDKADDIIAKQAQGAPGGNSMASAMANNQLIETLRQATNDKDGTRAIELARQILNHDPLAISQNGNENYLRTQALAALKKYGEIDAYTQGIEKQLAATPDSARLNWLAGEAYAAAGDSVRETRGLLPGYHWLKLQRTGNKFELFSSLDGLTWKPSGDTEIDFPPKLYIGTWVLSLEGPSATVVTFDHVALTGKLSPAPKPPQAMPDLNSATTPPVTGTTNAPAASAPPPASLPALWQQIDIGKVVTPGYAMRGADDQSLAFTGALSGVGFSNKDDAYHFVYQILNGDGSIITRIPDIYDKPDNTNCGVLMRESLDPLTRGVGASVSRRRGVVWEVRATVTDPWKFTEHREFTAPAWLKLARTGNKFTASYADNGRDWKEIFTRQVAIKPDAQAGLFFRNAQQNGQAILSEIALNGSPVPTPASGTLPATWRAMDIGPWATPGKVTWTSNGVQMQSPSGLATSDNTSPFGGYVCLPLTGDGELISRLDDLTPPGDAKAVAGLCFRDSNDADASDIHFVFASNGDASLFFKIDTEAQAARFFKKVAELDSKNPAMLITVAEQLRRAHKPDAAADLYTSILKADFATGMAQSGNVLQAFQDANRLPELVKIIQDWTPPQLNPMLGGGQDMYFVLVQLASQMRQGNHLPEAEQVLRKALTVDTFQPKQDGVAALAQLLMDEDRRDDAAAEIDKWIFDKNATTAPPPILGFNVQVQSQANWFQSMGWTSNGMIMAPIVHFLELADALGLSQKLRQEMNARAEKSTQTPGSQINSYRMAAILLAIMGHDPGYRTELDKLLKDYPLNPATMNVNSNAYLILSQQLEKWPEERPTALQLARQVYGGAMGAGNNTFFQNTVVMQMLQLELAAGDHTAIQETLRKRANSIRQQRAGNPSQVPLDQVLMIVRWMIQEGMIKDAESLLAETNGDPQLANGNSYFKQRIEDLQGKMAFAKGEKSPVALVYGVASKPAKSGSSTQLFWQLNAGSKDQGNSAYFSNTSWNDGIVSRPTSYKLEVSGGPDEQHLSPLASWPNVATNGSEPIKLPPGTQVLQAKLTGAKSATPGPVATGQVLLLGSVENLLKNPDFQVTRNAAGAPEIVGWRGILPASISPEPGGPLGATGYQSLEASNSSFAGVPEIDSDRIAIQPNTNYVFSGWMRLWGALGFQYLDASGKVLNPGQTDISASDTNWQWRAWCLQGDSHAPVGGQTIPSNAAFFQIVIKPSQDSDFAGLSVRVWPSPTAK